MKQNKYISMLLLFIAALLWGFAFVAQDLVADIPPITVGMVRWLIGALFLFFVIIVLDNVTKSGRKLISKKGFDFTRSEVIGGLVTGVIVSIASVFQQMGISQGTSGGKAAFITALYVVLVPIYALFLKKSAKINVWIAVFIAVIGFYFLCIKEDFGIVISDVWIIISAAIYPIQILAIDHYAPKCDCIRMSCLQFFFAFLVSAAGAFAFESPIDWISITTHIGPFLYLGICSSGIAYTLQVIGQKGAHPTVSAIILSSESMFAAIGGAMLLGQKMDTVAFIGCAVMMVGIVIAQIPSKGRK